MISAAKAGDVELKEKMDQNWKQYCNNWDRYTIIV